MTDPQSGLAEAPQPADTDSTHANFTPELTTRDTFSSDSSAPYEPLPQGRYKIAVHGNCPLCHHRHSGAEVKIKVTADVSHVSRVKCEVCGQTWAAFGGRNATVISLLSTTSTESDEMAKEVRLRLIDVVKMATAQAASSLGTVPEQLTYQPAQEPPAVSSSHENTLTPRSLEISIPATAVEKELPARLDGNPQSASKHSNGLRRSLSKLRKSITRRIPTSFRVSIQQRITSIKGPSKTLRQMEKSPVNTAPAGDQGVRGESSIKTDTHHGIEFAHLSRVTLPEGNVPGPATRFTDVASFLRDLDKSQLPFMDDKQRAAWLRRNYTDFKNRNQKHQTSLTISEVLGTSTDPYVPAESWDDRSLYVRATGAGFNRLGRVDSNNSSRERSSLSISDRFSEAPTVYDDITDDSVSGSFRGPLQRLRGEMQRPLSLPGATQASPLLRDLFRNSLPSSRSNGVEGTSTARDQEPVRWSQGAAYGGSTDVHDFASQESLHHPVNQEEQPRVGPASPRMSTSSLRNMVRQSR
jgi:DNA-directed RNA polymerase subunit M/transcription elongation factor TFIIS